MHLKNLARTLSFSVATFFATILPTQAGLLTLSHEIQLETWLGQGNQAFTNIFTSGVGDTGATFHAAVDNQGATFTLIEISGGAYNLPLQIIGGYNPNSWLSNNANVYTAPSAFIFNLTTNLLQNYNNNGYATYNGPGSGPTFGQGHDLVVHGDLQSGFSYNFSYGSSHTQDITSANTFYNPTFNVSKIEVYTIAPAGSSVPDTASTLGLSALGLLGMMAARRRRNLAS